MVAYVATQRYGEKILGRTFIRHKGDVEEGTVIYWETLLEDALDMKSLTVLSFQEVYDDGIGYLDEEKSE